MRFRGRASDSSPALDIARFLPLDEGDKGCKTSKDSLDSIAGSNIVWAAGESTTILVHGQTNEPERLYLPVTPTVDCAD